MDDAKLASAGVHFPPPFIYVAGFLIGMLLERVHSLPIAGVEPGTLQTAVEVAGIVFLVLWAVLMLAAFLTFARFKTTFIPNKPASALATTGPYRVTRNPMYVSMALLYLALVCLVNSWWPLILLPLVLWVVDRSVIAREERYLRSAFPEEYSEYCRRVRRWV